MMLSQKLTVYIFGLFSTILYFYIHFDIEKWVYTKCKKCVDYTYQLLDRHDSLGLVTIVLVLVALIIHCLEIKKDSYFSIRRYCLVSFGCIVWFLSLEHWSYNILYGWIRIDVFISLILLIYLGLFIYRSRCYSVLLEHRLVEVSDKKLFRIDANRKEYAETILQHVKQSAHDESYAVGLVGRWGSGKTCFLANLEHQLHQDEQLIYFFNAWNSKTPDNIIFDFFNDLSDLLSPFYSNLQRPLLKYAELLTAVEAHSSIVYLINQLEHATVSSLREEIIEALQSINKPIYILIDDVDRLTKEEVLEVMRLIRNTGNFPYLKYIVAYDKDYVEHRLEDMNIPASYLNKIFSIELILPQLTDHIEGDIMMDIFQKEINNQHVLSSLSLCVDSLYYKNQYFFSDFRQVERFAKQCALNINFILLEDRKVFYDFHLCDFFYTELLRFTDRKTYEELQSNPDLLLKIASNTSTCTSVYTLDKKNTKDLKEGTIFLLSRIFKTSKNYNVSRNRMAFLENYDKYFSYGISKNKISAASFGHLLIDSKSVTELEERVEEKMGNMEFVESLENQYLCTKTLKLELEWAKRYFDLCLILFEISDRLNVSAIKKMTNTSLKENVIPDLSQYVLDRLNLYINESSHHISLAKFLVNYLSFFDDNSSVAGILGISEGQILSMIRKNAINYLSANLFDAADIIDSRTKLNRFIKYHVVRNEVDFSDSDYFDYFDDNIIYTNLIIDEVISYFSQHKSTALQNVKDWVSIDPNIPQEGLEDEEERIERKINSLFASRKNFEAYKAQCFT